MPSLFLWKKIKLIKYEIFFVFHLLETKPKMIVLLDFVSPLIILVNDHRITITNLVQKLTIVVS